MRIVLIGGYPFPAINIIYSFLGRNSSDQVFLLDKDLNKFPAELKENPRLTLWHGTAKDKTLVKSLLSNAQVLIDIPRTEDTSFISEAELVEGYAASMSNILEFGKDLERIIYISSSKVYGAIADSPVSEEYACKPTNLKGVTETLGEKLAYYYSSKYSVPAVVLRTFNLYGPYQSLEHTIASLITSALRDEPLRLWQEGEQIENLLFVEDFTEALQKTLKTKIDSLRGEVINIGSLGAIAVKEISNTILSRLNKPQTLISYERNNNQCSTDLVPSIMKAKILLSWSPRIGIEKGLEKTIDWYIKNRDWWDTEL